MPTENRSSNTEMVSVPRELTDDICHGLRITQERAREELRALLAKPAEQRQDEPIYQVMYRGDGGGGWCDVEKDSYDMKVPHPKHWETRIVYTRPAEQPPTSTTSDKYKAELYDEVWQLARDMGFGNVTDALMKLQSQIQGKKSRKEHICTPVAKTELS